MSPSPARGNTGSPCRDINVANVRPIKVASDLWHNMKAAPFAKIDNVLCCCCCLSYDGCLLGCRPGVGGGGWGRLAVGEPDQTGQGPRQPQGGGTDAPCSARECWGYERERSHLNSVNNVVLF